MNIRNNGLAKTLLALLVLAAVGGCGTTKKARLAAWHTAQYDVRGIERLAVLGFRAPAEVASAVESTTLKHLHQTGFYQVIHDSSRSQFQASHVPLPTEVDGIRQIVARGRQLGADAVLVGRVRKRLNEGAEFGNFTLRIGEPELGVMIEYYVVDVHTRSIRAKQRIARTQSDEGLAGDSAFTARAVDSLARQCAKEMVSQITAGSNMIDVQLATLTLGKGSGYLQDGNKLAGEGKWQQAAEEYLSATKVNPDCHQAIYNLGLAAEAQGRFGEAKQMYNKAIEKSDEPLYRDALTRVSSAGSNYQVARRQIAQRPRGRFRNGPGRQTSPNNGAQVGYQPAKAHRQQPPQNVNAHSPAMHSPAKHRVVGRQNGPPNMYQRPSQQPNSGNTVPREAPHYGKTPWFPQYGKPDSQDPRNSQQNRGTGTQTDRARSAGQFHR